MPALLDVVAHILADSELLNLEDCPFSAHLNPDNTKVCFVAGENASGKSLIGKFVRAWLPYSRPKAKPISVTIVERTGSGTSEMAKFRRVMMFGDESEQSTGETSVSIVCKALENCKRRIEEDKDEILLVLDEPELGLSTGYHHALGFLIGQEIGILQRHEAFVGVLMVSHSREMYQGLQSGLQDSQQAAPSFLSMGTSLTAQQWLQSAARKSVKELLDLKQVARERRRYVQTYFNQKR